jgi:hypothetical protein
MRKDNLPHSKRTHTHRSSREITNKADAGLSFAQAATLVRERGRHFVDQSQSSRDVPVEEKWRVLQFIVDTQGVRRAFACDLTTRNQRSISSTDASGVLGRGTLQADGAEARPGSCKQRVTLKPVDDRTEDGTSGPQTLMK